MKKILLVLMFGCLTTSLFAQDTGLKPVQGDLGFTIGATGIAPFAYTPTSSFLGGAGGTMQPSGTLLIHYYLTNQWSLRGQLNITSASTSQTYTLDSIQSNHPGNYSVSTKSSSWNVGLGIQRSFNATKHLEPYLALEIYLGSGKALDTSETWSGTGSTFSGYTASYTTTPGSMFTFGAGLVAGFNYFISDHVALGGEFLFGYSSINVDNGTATTVYTYPAADHLPTSTTTTLYPGTDSHFFGPNASATITLSIFFPAKW